MGSTNKTIFGSMLYPSLFVLILWGIKGYEIAFDISLAEFGLYPRSLKGTIGIVTAPLLHGSLKHLLANTFPLLILGTLCFYFYRSIAFQIFFWVYLTTNIWVWTAARESYHIGASGIIYGFESFLFFSGIFRKDTKLLAISLLVVFLYGSTVWGVLPLQKGVSWESHLLGAVSGLIIAYSFRKEGPQRKKYEFEEEEEVDKLAIFEEAVILEEIENNQTSTAEDIVINIEYKPTNRTSEN